MLQDIGSSDDEDLTGLGRDVLGGLPDDASLYDGGIAPLRRYDLVSGHIHFYHATFCTTRHSGNRGGSGIP